LSGGLLCDALVAEYQDRIANLPRISALLDAVSVSLKTTTGDGYLIIGCRTILDNCELDEALNVLTSLVTMIGVPLRAFDRWDLWKPIGTNLDIDPIRATGIGFNPLHIDIVNATHPPDYSALLCVRRDPMGLGYNLVSNLREARWSLTQRDERLLRDAVFSDGSFYDLTGVGREYDPFPIIDDLPPRSGFIRFTAKMLADRDPQDPHTRAARAYEKELHARCHRFLLDPGDLVVFNQHLACHGREALGPNQHQLPAPRRRLMMQLFLREPEAWRSTQDGSAGERLTDSPPGSGTRDQARVG
jgi:hypothetical protein